MKRILDFCNLLGQDGRLSITNIALIALVVKMCASPSLDWPAVVTLITVFANYMHKRKTINDSTESESLAKMKDIQDQYNKAVITQAEVIKDTADKVKQLSQAFSLSNLVKQK